MKRIASMLAFLCLLALLHASVPAPLAAQDQPAADPAAQFDRTMADWKQLLTDMRAMQVRYQNAGSAAESRQIEEQWDELIAKGEGLMQRLRADAVAAFRASPDDGDVVKLLLQLLQDDVEADRYEEAYPIGLALAEKPGASKEVLALAGTACFCVNDYENAERIFKIAESMPGQMPREAANFASLLPSYKELWKEEQAARKRDEETVAPRVRLKTSQGEIDVELFENEAPDTVGNFIHLVEQGFYDGLTFHRVIPNFMAQGGCPEGTGGGGPGYQIYCECYKPDHRKHFRGTLSMAHAGRDTGGSQFFLTFVPTAHLNGKHTAFGRVVDGMEVLAKLRRRDPGSAEKADVIIEAAVLRKDEDKVYEPQRVP